MTCETGHRQSPSTSRGPITEIIINSWSFITKHLKLHEFNNGHTIQVSHVSGCRVDLNDRAYQLRQFHFHAPSEHHIEGKAFPMEMHLVHQDDKGHVLVLAAMLAADSPNPVPLQTVGLVAGSNRTRSFDSFRTQAG